MTFTFRPFHPSDTIRLEGVPTVAPAFGLTAVREGEPIGYAGIVFMLGRAVVFFHSTDGDVRRPMFLHRSVARWLSASRALGITDMWALCDDRWDRAPEWLARLGFRRVEEGERDERVAALEQASGKGAWVYVGDGASGTAATRSNGGRDGRQSVRPEQGALGTG